MSVRPANSTLRISCILLSSLLYVEDAQASGGGHSGGYETALARKIEIIVISLCAHFKQPSMILPLANHDTWAGLGIPCFFFVLSNLRSVRAREGAEIGELWRRKRVGVKRRGVKLEMVRGRNPLSDSLQAGLMVSPGLGTETQVVVRILISDSIRRVRTKCW